MMVLNNVYRVGDDKAGNISISGGHIIDGLTSPLPQTLQLVFDKAIAFPGIINSHDHLDFNLFPKMGDRIYQNYTEWGHTIQQNYRDEIDAIVKIPAKLRTKWGIYKNLLCGVTTVVNHGAKPGFDGSPITILKNERSLHSVHFEKGWRYRLNQPFKKGIPVVIHTGEGTDQAAADEIDQLLHWNLMRRKLVGVHGVAMTAKQARRFKALVWCPQSNYFLLDATANISELKKELTVLFGTDSTLTGDWNIWEHIRLARKTGLLTDEELLKHLSSNPAAIWKINSGEIATGYNASIVVARMSDENNPVESLFNTNPADILLVLHEGNIRLFDEVLYNQLTALSKSNFSKIAINGHYKYVYGDLPGLINEIKQYHPDVQFPVSSN